MSPQYLFLLGVQGKTVLQHHSVFFIMKLFNLSHTVVLFRSFRKHILHITDIKMNLSQLAKLYNIATNCTQRKLCFK